VLGLVGFMYPSSRILPWQEPGRPISRTEGSYPRQEESMETLSSIFSSLKFNKEKAFVGKEQKFMYVLKVSVPKP
jgi:hypothetical protein